MALGDTVLNLFTNSRKRITGLIGPIEPAGTCLGNSDDWRLVIHMAAYRYGNDQTIRKKTRFELPVSKKELSREMDSLNAYQIIEADLRDDSDPNAVILKKIRKRNCQDSELEDIANQLKKPISIETQRFGKLSYRRDLEYFSCDVEWNGMHVELCLNCTNPNDHTEFVETAELLFANQSEWQSELEKFTVKELLKLKNDTWLDENESPLTPDEFIAKMDLQTISIEEDGGFTFWHNDGGLFWGHTIEISGDLLSGLKYADIPG